MSDQDTYLIHDNGKCPYMVIINENNVSVHINLESGYVEYDRFEEQSLYNFKANKIFIGKDKGPNPIDGNSILLHMRDNEYVCIGSSIFSFTSKSEIIEYHSPICNNDVPYPYGIDIDGNYYLFMDAVILINTGDLAEIITSYSEPCPYFYYIWPNKSHPKAFTEKIYNIEVIRE